MHDIDMTIVRLLAGRTKQRETIARRQSEALSLAGEINRIVQDWVGAQQYRGQSDFVVVADGPDAYKAPPKKCSGDRTRLAIIVRLLDERLIIPFELSRNCAEWSICFDDRASVAVTNGGAPTAALDDEVRKALEAVRAEIENPPTNEDSKRGGYAIEPMH